MFVLAFGTGLLGGMQRHWANEFAIRSKVMPAIAMIRGATTTAARLLQREHELGVIAPGTAGDFVITDADPLADIDVLAGSGLSAVIQDGTVVKRY
jgi:imidazolonepropionase-like amidohydrolase